RKLRTSFVPKPGLRGVDQWRARPCKTHVILESSPSGATGRAESFIWGAALRTARAGRSAEDRLLCKQEALGSNPSRSILPELEAQLPYVPTSVQTLVTFPVLFRLAPMIPEWRPGRKKTPRFSLRHPGTSVSHS